MLKLSSIPYKFAEEECIIRGYYHGKMDSNIYVISLQYFNAAFLPSSGSQQPKQYFSKNNSTEQKHMKEAQWKSLREGKTEIEGGT